MPETALPCARRNIIPTFTLNCPSFSSAVPHKLRILPNPTGTLASPIRWAPELVSLIDGLSPENRQKSDVSTPLKRIAQWATAMQFFEHVLRRNTTTLHLDDDAILLPNFCAAGNRAIKRVVQGKFGFRQLAFASPALWVRRGFDSLYFGHCYEFYGHRVDSVGLNVKGKCFRVSEREFLSIATTPFCEHAYALSPQGAAKLLAALSSWNVTYTAFHRQRVTQHGWMWPDQPGRGESRRAYRRLL